SRKSGVNRTLPLKPKSVIILLFHNRCSFVSHQEGKYAQSFLVLPPPCRDLGGLWPGSRRVWPEPAGHHPPPVRLRAWRLAGRVGVGWGRTTVAGRRG